MPVVGPSAMPWGGRPTAASRPAIPARTWPAPLATRSAATEAASAPGSGPVVTGSPPSTGSRPASTRRSCPVDGCAAAHVPASAPLGGSRAAHHPPIGARSGPIGLHHGPRATFARPLGPRSARHRLVTGPRRSAQGPPAPTPAAPAQFPRPCGCADPWPRIRSTGFGFLDSGSELDFGF